MKKFIKLLLILPLTFLFSCKPSADEAGKFNDKIIDLQVRIQTAENKLVEDYKDGDAAKMEPALNKFMEEVKTCTAELDKLEKFDGKDDFKMAAQKMFGVYKSVGETEYTEMLKIFKEPDEEYTEEKHARVLQLDSILNVKESAGMAELKKVQEKFAADYRVVIEKTPDTSPAK